MGAGTRPPASALRSAPAVSYPPARQSRRTPVVCPSSLCARLGYLRATPPRAATPAMQSLAALRNRPAKKYEAMVTIDEY